MAQLGERRNWGLGFGFVKLVISNKHPSGVRRSGERSRLDV